MKVLFDNQIFRRQIYGGISKYFYELNQALPIDFSSIQKGYHINKLLSQTQKELFLPYYFYSILQLRDRYSEKLIKTKADCVHSTYYVRKPKRFKHLRNIITVHDMIHEEILDKDQYYKKQYCEIADLIICISNATKLSLLSKNPNLEKKTIVIHSGVSEFSFYSDINSIEENVLKNNYFVFIGERYGINKYKNFDALIDVFFQNKKYFSDNGITLKIIGSLPSRNEKIKLNELGLESLFNFQGQLDEFNKSKIISNSRAIIVPSFFEGFSLSVVEAIVNDVPVICSRIPVHVEVAQNAAIFFDPYSNNELSSFLKKTSIPKPSEIIGFENWKKLKNYYKLRRLSNDYLKAYSNII